MRYFTEISYLGTDFHGWQRQPNALSVQEVLEEKMALLLRQETEIVGCGRTDAGVHARHYVFHFDGPEVLPEYFSQRLNKLLPPSIAVHRITAVAAEAHARFDAHHRAYEYHLTFQKDPFTQNTAFYFPFGEQLDLEALQAAAGLLLNYEAFFPFCKTHSDVKTMKCQMQRSEWVVEVAGEKLVYHIAANRFLRGMVRLIVGMCLNVGLGKVSLEEVQQAMEKQERLSKSYSVPPEGLFLKDIRYPYEW